MRISLRDKILNNHSRVILYSLTPPKITTAPERVHEISQNQIDRLNNLQVDGLILYDIQDESQRTNETRTFSFIPTIAPEKYANDFLSRLTIPKIIYKSIANMSKADFEMWLQNNMSIDSAVFVGASSQGQVEQTNFSLNNAYELRQNIAPELLLGGITIPERHAKKGDEHLRIRKKMDYGCSFFISQCVYNINETKNLMSDYYYEANDNSRQPAPLIFTLAPCGSLKTLQFMEWLGIQVPRWLFNDLRHSKDILQSSVHICKSIASEILEFADKKNIPVGFNIESISIKKEEINASIEILSEVIQMTHRKSQSSAVAEVMA